MRSLPLWSTLLIASIPILGADTRAEEELPAVALQATSSVRREKPIGTPEQAGCIAPSDSPSVENEWYLRTEDKKAKLYVWEVGRGEPVVVVHGGFGAEQSYLYDAFRGLTDRFRVIFYDQRGSLRSACKPEDITVDRHLDDLDLLRRELKLDRVTLFGHSMGSYLVMAYLARYPEHVANVVLVGALIADSAKANVVSVDAKKLMERPEVARELDRVRQTGVKGEKLETHLWRVQFAGVNFFHVERWRQMKGGQAFYDARAGQAAAKSLPKKWNYTQRMHDYPVTIIKGDHDFLDFGGKYYSEFAKTGKHVTYVLLKDAGHNPWVDDPKAFHKGLLSALTSKP
jgi:pimeloyl-ACP methyl ester carboxylesterase